MWNPVIIFSSFWVPTFSYPGNTLRHSNNFCSWCGMIANNSVHYELPFLLKQKLDFHTFFTIWKVKGAILAPFLLLQLTFPLLTQLYLDFWLTGYSIAIKMVVIFPTSIWPLRLIDFTAKWYKKNNGRNTSIIYCLSIFLKRMCVIGSHPWWNKKKQTKTITHTQKKNISIWPLRLFDIINQSDRRGWLIPPRGGNWKLIWP